MWFWNWVYAPQLRLGGSSLTWHLKLWIFSFKIEYMHLGFASTGAVWLGIWNSDHVVLKSSIRTSASPRWQQSHWGLRVTQEACFSLLTHTKQLLLVTFCDTLAGIEVRFGRTEPDGRTEPRNDGWTDRRGSRNSYLDIFFATAVIHHWMPWLSSYLCPDVQNIFTDDFLLRNEKKRNSRNLHSTNKIPTLFRFINLKWKLHHRINLIVEFHEI